MEKRKTVEIPEELMEEEWKSNKVVIKRLTLGENMKIRDEATNISIKNDGVNGTLRQEVAIVEKLNKSIVEAPWKVGDRGIVANLDGVLGEWLLSEVQEFGTFPVKKKKT